MCNLAGARTVVLKMAGWIMAWAVCVIRVIPISNLHAMEKTLSNHAASVDDRIEAVTICHARRADCDTESKSLRGCVTGKAIDSLD
jgi:uncharacterized protein YoxC